jgi:hypothetical protein
LEPDIYASLQGFIAAAANGEGDANVQCRSAMFARYRNQPGVMLRIRPSTHVGGHRAQVCRAAGRAPAPGKLLIQSISFSSIGRLHGVFPSAPFTVPRRGAVNGTSPAITTIP